MKALWGEIKLLGTYFLCIVDFSTIQKICFRLRAYGSFLLALKPLYHHLTWVFDWLTPDWQCPSLGLQLKTNNKLQLGGAESVFPPVSFIQFLEQICSLSHPCTLFTNTLCFSSLMWKCRRLPNRFHSLAWKAFFGFTNSASSLVKCSKIPQGATVHIISSGRKGVLVESWWDFPECILTRMRATVVSWSTTNDLYLIFKSKDFGLDIQQ